VSPRNTAYNSTEIPLQFYAKWFFPSWSQITDLTARDKVVSVRYWLDGQLLGQDSGEDLPKTYSTTLAGLSAGQHYVKAEMTVYDEFDEYLKTDYSDATPFTVETGRLEIRFLTTQEAFEVSDVALNFIVNKPVSWLGYSLDGNAVREATDLVASTKWAGLDNYRLVLKDLHPGGHSVTVYAEDLAGNRGASEPFSFTVTAGAPSGTSQASTLFPTATAVAIAVIASVAAVSFGLVACFLRRKKKSGET
jgi:hypothetical protein